MVMEEEEQSFELPRFISVDDHVVEPHGLWQDRLPSKYKAQGPRVAAAEGSGGLQRRGPARVRRGRRARRPLV